MNLQKPSSKVHEGFLTHYRYNLLRNLGENGSRLTGCEAHIALSRRAAQEGMVLLENNGYLPLPQGICVSLFGLGTLEHIKGGGGSGQVYPAYVSCPYEGFAEKAPRYSIYQPVSDFYYAYGEPRIRKQGVNDVLAEPSVPEELITDAAAHSDAAIVVVRRYSGEYFDRHAEKGDFYLTDDEDELIQKVSAHFAHTVVVLNTGGMMDVSWAKTNPKIDAVLLAWQAGMEGGRAIADILCGDANPSGRLTDTLAAKLSDYPFADDFNESRDYVNYHEDIYVGYRYFETIPGVAQKVVYPFGYGLSYTTFAISKPEAAVNGDEIVVRTQVENTGSCPGKEVVQVYYSAPKGVLGKPNVCLAAFQKTQLLQPGKKQALCLRFRIADMASFDDLGKLQKSAYVLEQGDYRFFAGKNCRDLQECDFRYSVKEEFIVTRQLTQLCPPVDLKKRLLWDGTFEELPAAPIPTPLVSPFQGQPATPVVETAESFTKVAYGKMTLDDFVDQMTDAELVGMVSGVPKRGLSNTGGWGEIKRLHIPSVMTIDGPAGVKTQPDANLPTTAFPCATLVACTWDPEIAYAIGVAGGMECKENALGTWLTPGMNIHRNPLCGRNFEYFSEDPLISGKFAAAAVRGIQSTGTAATPKHYAGNNKEVNRYHSDSRMSERAMREIYLRGFEICVKESDPKCLMTSYNLINRQRVCESLDLLQHILREEWGFRGMVTSDWQVPCDQVNCVLAGNDVRMPFGFPDKLKEALENGRLHREDLKICTKRILKMILTMADGEK